MIVYNNPTARLGLSGFDRSHMKVFFSEHVENNAVGKAINVLSFYGVSKISVETIITKPCIFMDAQSDGEKVFYMNYPARESKIHCSQFDVRKGHFDDCWNLHVEGVMGALSV